MKRHSAIVALLALAMMAATSLMPAAAKGTAHSRYDHMITLRFKEKWLLPAVQLPESESAYILDFKRKLRPFSSGAIASDINKVDMTFQGAPFGPDVLKSSEQARALTELGVLATMGHYAVVNANNPNVRAGAVAILNQLADVADHFKLGNLASQYQRLANDVGDARFMGGPSPIVQRYDTTVSALYDWVAFSYGVDGHWFFTNGNCWAGLYVLASHGDQLHTDYYLSVLNDLYHSKPRLSPDGYTRSVLRDVSYDAQRDSVYLTNVSWATVMHYTSGSKYYANPRQPHFTSGLERMAP